MWYKIFIFFASAAEFLQLQRQIANHVDLRRGVKAQLPTDSCEYCGHNVLFWCPGPPGPPGGLLVKNVAETSVELKWSRGYDNHSPIGRYVIMGRSSLSSEWRKMMTGVWWRGVWSNGQNVVMCKITFWARKWERQIFQRFVERFIVLSHSIESLHSIISSYNVAPRDFSSVNYSIYEQNVKFELPNSSWQLPLNIYSVNSEIIKCRTFSKIPFQCANYYFTQ